MLLSIDDIMMRIPWPQIYGAMAGGVVGGFSGFVANSIHRSVVERHQLKSIGCALMGEIGALCQHIESSHELRTVVRRDDPNDSAQTDTLSYYSFRGERDYMPIFRSLGAMIGQLPSPLPRDLVYWYTGLTVCLERARELHDLALSHDGDWPVRAIHVTRLQREGFNELLKNAAILIEELDRL
jgi:hypothetical protein